jgi:hypothetical protein
MANIFSQQGLGSMLQNQLDVYDKRKTQAVNRQLVQAQIDAQKAKAAQMRDPSYAASQQPSAVQEYQFYQGLSPEEQQRYLSVKRSTPEEALMRKGVRIDPATGQAIPLSGYADVLGGIEAAKVGATGQAKIETAKAAELKEREAMLPELEKTIAELNELGKQATYTRAGQLRDLFLKETGQEESEGALARTAYVAMVDNQILPLLRQTFGAAFTAAEGDRLRNTLGDPNKSPKAKKFVLDAFIKQKKKDIKSLKRELESQTPSTASDDVISYEEFLK